ncbi:hypothetical protein ACFLYO_11900, partial [Chloroflexota bacterium]
GPSVHLVVQSTGNGVWFRVRYGHSKAAATCPETIDELLEQLSGNWRLENTSFEIRTAADFVALSGSQLHLQGSETFCEMAFFVYAIGHRPPEPLQANQVTQPPPIASSTTEELLISLAAGAVADSDTKPLPETEVNNMIEATILDVFGENEIPPPTEDEAPAPDDPESQDDSYVVTPEELESWPVIKLDSDDTVRITNTRLEDSPPRIVWSRALREAADENDPDSADEPTD